MTTGPSAPEIDVEEAKRRHEAGAVLLDVRTPDEWTAGRAGGSTWIPMGELSTRQGELPTDREIVVICRSGARSARVADALLGAGYLTANVTGGLQAWDAAGFEVVADDGQPGTVA